MLFMLFVIYILFMIFILFIFLIFLILSMLVKLPLITSFTILLCILCFIYFFVRRKKFLSKSCLFNVFMLFMCVKYFCKKTFKTVLITPCVLLRFQSLQYFPMMTICFHDHNIFSLSQSFLIITIFMKIYKCINSII